MNEDEEIKIWEEQLDKMDRTQFTPGMKKLFNKVDVLIRKKVLTYKEFASDLVDASTDMILTPFVDEKGKPKSKEDQLEDMCTMICTIYDSKWESFDNVNKVEPQTDMESTPVI